MVMETLQIRMNHGLVRLMDTLVRKGIYSNRSDVIRDAVRRFVWENESGSIKRKGNSVHEIRKARNELSKEIKNFKDIEEINRLGE